MGVCVYEVCMHGCVYGVCVLVCMHESVCVCVCVCVCAVCVCSHACTMKSIIAMPVLWCSSEACLYHGVHHSHVCTMVFIIAMPVPW